MDRYAGGDVRLNTYEIKCANKNRDGIRSTIADYIIQLEENGILTINTEQL